MAEIFIVVRTTLDDDTYKVETRNIAAFTCKEDATIRVLILEDALQMYRKYDRRYDDSESVLYNTLKFHDNDVGFDGSYKYSEVSWEVHTIELN